MSGGQKTLQRLIALEPIKTWSIIVTLLGDMKQPSLSGKAIGKLLGLVGLKPEAARVALHRLKNDGWIETSKNGREVIYQLSDAGRAATSAAYSDVYRTTSKYPGEWKLCLIENDDQLQETGEQAIRLLKQLYLLPKGVGGEIESAMEFGLADHTIPTWVENKIVPVEVLALADSVNTLAIDALKQRHSSGSIEAAALRLLFLHRWRKMALRESTWAHIGLFPDGALANCHCNVTQLLATTTKLSANQIC